MALRQLGSSLVAKALPGSPLRETAQGRVEKPNIPGKGDIGSIQRQMIEEPTLRQIPSGSERIVRATPTAESIAGASVPSVPDVDLLATAAPGAFPAPGADNQALFQGGVTPTSSAPAAASQVARGGRVAKSVSGPGAPEPVGPRGEVAGASTSVQSPTQVTRESALPTAFSFLSGRAAAGEEQRPTIESRGFGATGVERQGNQVTFTPTAGQLLAGFTGKVINAAGQALGNRLPEKNISENLQRFGGAVGPAIVGQGSISSALRSIAQPVKNVVSNVRSAASNAFSNLRSLLGKKR